jgi:hypothetical protein
MFMSTTLQRHRALVRFGLSSIASVIKASGLRVTG